MREQDYTKVDCGILNLFKYSLDDYVRKVWETMWAEIDRIPRDDILAANEVELAKLYWFSENWKFALASLARLRDSSGR